MLSLAVGVLAFVVSNRSRVVEFPAWQPLVAAFVCLLVGGACTILEGFFWARQLNLLEHLSYALSSLLMMFWCWKLITLSNEQC